MRDGIIIKKLKKLGYHINDDVQLIKRIEIKQLILFVSDTRNLHDSGYPFIRIFGEIENKQLLDLGWHDHYIIEAPVNVDALGKNIFRIFSWMKTQFYINPNPMWCSTFQIRKDGELR